jgi:Kef-type K+ transport system membrane component KefB|eukprot:g517.t1
MNASQQSSGSSAVVAVPFSKEAGALALAFAIFGFERLFSRIIKTSSLLGHLIAGIIVGPACLDIVPYAEAWRFLGKLGVMLLVVEAGLEVDGERVRKHGARAFAAALSGTIFPVLLALFGAVVIFEADVRVGLAAGSAIAPTSLGFSAKLLGPEGLQTQLGSIIAIAAVVDDVLSLCLLEIVRALATAISVWDYVRPVIASAGSIAVGLLVAVLFKKYSLPGRARARGGDAGILTSLSLLVLGLSWACAAMGSSDLLGCFMSGVAFSGSIPSKQAFKTNFGRLTKVGTSLFFACSVGFGVPSLLSGSGLFSGPALARGAWLLFAGIVGKAFPLGLFATPLTWGTFFKFSSAMQGRGEFSFLIADTAKAEGILDEGWHAGSVWGVFLASLFAPFAFRAVLNREKVGEGGNGAGGKTKKGEESEVEVNATSVQLAPT